MRDRVVNCDCIKFMRATPDASFDFILTDIPYGECGRTDGSIRNLDKGNANRETFALGDFLPEVYRLARGSLVVFCSAAQFSGVRNFFKAMPGTVRSIVWEKTNPMPVNARSVYLSGVEHGVWFRRPGAAFNAFCKNTVFRYPCGSSRLHPTEKNLGLLKELILDNTSEGDIVFDPLAGSGSSLLAAKELGRRFYGCEIDPGYCALANSRLK